VLRNEFGVRTFGYTSFVVEPPDVMPVLTPAGQAKQRVGGCRHLRRQAVQRLLNFGLTIAASREASRASPVLYGNGLRIMQTQNGDRQLRDDSRHARHSARRAPARGLEHQAI
jgi:hypothetical protein